MQRLNDQSEGATHVFLKYLGKVFNEHVSVETYRSGSNAVLNHIEGMPHHYRFLVANNLTEMDNPQAFLVRQLYNQQAQAIK